MRKKSLKILVIISVISLSTIPTTLKSVAFGNPFGVMLPGRKLTKPELIQAIRLMISSEYEAVQNYTQLADSIDDELAKKVLLDIANEERVHAGEFLRVLKHLDPEEEKFYQEGTKEVEENIKKLEKTPEPKVEQKVEPKAEPKIEPKVEKPAEKQPEKQVEKPKIATVKVAKNKNTQKIYS